jgi:cerevisin
VAKKAEIYAVKVLRSNGSGSMSDVIKGVEFAAESHLKKLASGKDKNFKGSVANMSLGGGKVRNHPGPVSLLQLTNSCLVSYFRRGC